MKSFKMTPLRSLDRYRRSDDGSLSIEAVLVAPLVLMGLLFCYTYFSAFQLKGISNKAAYTISDYISRQTDPIDADFIEGLADIYSFLTNTGNRSVRVSSVVWRIVDGEGEYQLQWSYAADGKAAVTSETLAEIEDRLPIMGVGETVVVVETATRWSPIFNVGLDKLNFTDIVTTKPRFATQVVFVGGPDAPEDPDPPEEVDKSDSYKRYGGKHHKGKR